MKFKVCFQLSLNRFCICWVPDVWAFDEIWQNRVFGHFSIPLLCVNCGILYNYISFVGIFRTSSPTRSSQIREAFEKESETISFMKHTSNLTLILNTFCNLKRYFRFLVRIIVGKVNFPLFMVKSYFNWKRRVKHLHKTPMKISNMSCVFKIYPFL